MTAVVSEPTPTSRPEPAAPQAVRQATFPRAAGHGPGSGLRSLWAERLTGAPVRPSGDSNHRGHSFADMCAALLTEIDATENLDLVVLAHVTPDLDPRDSVAGALAAPDRLVFAVSDQGRLAPFTALRLAMAFPDRPHAAVIVLDQAVVPYADPDLSALDETFDHAVALRPALGFHPVRQWADITGDRVTGVLEPALAVEHPDLVILGPALPPPAGFTWRRAPGDQLGTAVFSALSAELTGTESDGARPGEAQPDGTTLGRPRRITVVEYEPALRGLALVTWSEPSPPARHLAPVPDLRSGPTDRR